jgi:P-type E1-E2 ATPase
MQLTHLVLDFTGTLSLDGKLLPGVAVRLRDLAEDFQISVLTADTFGTARSELKDLPVEVRVVPDKEKADIVEAMGADHVVAIGNGRNDLLMLERVRLGIVVIGPSGCAAELIDAAAIVTRDVWEALDLLTHPRRLTAALRE